MVVVVVVVMAHKPLLSCEREWRGRLKGLRTDGIGGGGGGGV